MKETVVIEHVYAQGLPDVRSGLVDLLPDTVNGGASVGFLPPISRADAEAYWLEVHEALRSGARRLLVARQGDRVVGTVQLDPSMRSNGLHRAEVMKVMVHPHARRQGLARRLMEEIERVARADGRTLLVLDTRQGEPSEALYDTLGYVRAGVIPGYARSADGTLHATVVFYKTLG